MSYELDPLGLAPGSPHTLVEQRSQTPRQTSLQMIDEIKRRVLFFFIGFAAEYSLGRLHRRMRAAGFECIEIDEFTHNSITALTAARETDRMRVLLTSQRMHFGKSGRWVVDSNLPFTSALEAHALLQPHFAVAAPHTLNVPSFPDEAPMLHAFDLYLASSEDEKCFAPYCAVEVVGWLKSDVSHDAPDPLELRNNAVWLARTATQIPDFEKYADYVASVIDGKCSIKFMVWPYTSRLEAALQKRGQHIIPASVPIAALAQTADWIICNGPTGNVQECRMLGRKIYLYPDGRLGDETEVPRMWTSAQEPNCRIVRALDEVFLSQPDAKLAADWNPARTLDGAIDALLRHVGPAMERFNGR
jgi:hypothetical protein